MLPEMVPFTGIWEEYLERVYSIYMEEVANAALRFNRQPIRCRFLPESYGKGFGFWHCISEGRDEEERTPDFDRCRRIRWIAWMIRNHDTDARITWWEETRGRATNILLWLEEEDYLVVLEKRSGYLLLKTAYVADKPHKKRQLAASRAKFWSAGKD